MVYNFAARPLVSKKIIPEGSLAQKKSQKIDLQASNPHIFSITTPNSVIFVPKIPESLLLLLSTFIIHMFVVIIYCLYLFVLGTIVLEPFIGDFQDLPFD
jgi:hypothetical protein